MKKLIGNGMFMRALFLIVSLGPTSMFLHAMGWDSGRTATSENALIVGHFVIQNRFFEH